MGNTTEWAADVRGSILTSATSLTSAATSFVSMIDQKLKEFADREAKLNALEESLAYKSKKLDERQRQLDEREKLISSQSPQVKPIQSPRGSSSSSSSSSSSPKVQSRSSESPPVSPRSSSSLTNSSSSLGGSSSSLTGSSSSLKSSSQSARPPQSQPITQPPSSPPVSKRANSAFQAFEGDLLSMLLQEPFNEWLPNHVFTLVYKAKKDGFSADDFHSHCDEKGPTLVIIQSTEGYLFGGYAPVSWDSSNAWRKHPDCFVFTLTNPHNVPPTKYTIRHGKSAIHCNPKQGPIFGAGPDISVVSNPNKNESTFFFPQSFNDFTGRRQATFTGNANFLIRDMEVYIAVSKK